MAKIVDENGFRTYLDVPITTEGVYDYAGFQIDQNKKFNLDPKKIYKVYRPASELLKEEFVKSLEEMPLTDDHTPLGEGNGLLAAEKNTHGVLFNIRVNEKKNGLLGDIKVFSETLKKKIDNGKREISLGYTCFYKASMGMYNGQGYEFVQTDLYANHCALVDAARMGHSCRVTDSKIVACDSLELPTMPEKTEEKTAVDELIEKLKGCSDEDLKKVKDFLGGEDKPEEDKKEEKPEEQKPEEDEKPEEKPEEETKDEEPKEDEKPEEDKSEEEKPADDKKLDEEKKDGCGDANVRSAIDEYKKAQRLAEDCKSIVGTIAMDGIYTEKDVARKVCGLIEPLKNVAADSAIAALKGFLAGHGKTVIAKSTVADGKVTARSDFASAFKARK